MKCPNCQSDNPSQARFCSNCGQPLVLRCGNCRAELSLDARFCIYCGYAVRSQSSDDLERHTRLAAAAPASLAQKARSASLTGERRTVTVLFADVVGSTRLAEQVDIETWAALMNGAFECITPAIYRFEGTIARLLGDSLLAFFGAPVAHEDDPVRAVHAALDALESIQAYAQEVRAAHGINFEMRFCLNTGPVVIGAVGSDLKYEYTAMGGAVNLAALLKFTGRPMAVLMTENTHRFIEPTFESVDLGMIQVAERKEGLRAYQVMGPKAEPGTLRGLVGLVSPLVGRDKELNTLLNLTQTVCSGVGRAVLVQGEPGLGKTRLVAEWQDAVASGGQAPLPQWAEGRCLSYGQGMAHHLILDLLRSLLGVSDIAGETETRAALESLIKDLFPDEMGGSGSEVYTYLSHLLMLDREGEAPEMIRVLDPQALQAQYISALRKTLHVLAMRRPVILILEDLHWIDPSSAEILGNLLSLVFTSPILFCMVMRPERDTAGWKAINTARQTLGSSLTEIALEPLSDLESRQLVGNLLAIEALPESMRSLILQKSEGNPFFVEEVVRMLIEHGAIVQTGAGWTAGSNLEQVNIPDNLQGLLMARIDRLSDEGKRTLKVASVVGRKFSARILQQVLAGSTADTAAGMESTMNALSGLESSGLILISEVQPDLIYYFRHTLVQDAAYASLLASDRQRLHLAVGETVEMIYPDQVTSCEMAPRLGQHFNEAGDMVRALKYFRIAGESALKCFANQEAESHFRKALSLADSDQECAGLLVGLGEALAGQSRYFEAIEIWQEAIHKYRSLGDLQSVARIYAQAARAAWWAGDTPRGLSICQEGMQVCEGAPESVDLARLIHETARAYHFNGVPEPAKELCLKALEMADRLGDVEVQADALTTLGILPGQSPQAETDALEKAIRLAETAGLLIIASRAHINLGSVARSFWGDYEAARFHYQRALDIARQRGVAQEEIFAQGVLLGVYLESGQLDLVEEKLPVLEKLTKEVPSSSAINLEIENIRSILNLCRGESERALESLRDQRDEARRLGNLQALLNIDMTLIMATTEMHHSGDPVDWDEAEGALEETLELCDRGLGIRAFPLAYGALVRVRQKRLDEAREFLQEAKSAGEAHTLALLPAILDWIEAEIGHAAQDWETARTAFEGAYGKSSKLSHRWFSGRFAIAWAEALIDHGEMADLERARPLLREATAIFEQLRAPVYLKQIEQLRQMLHERNLAQAAAQRETSQDLAQARKLQRSFLPQEIPVIAGWEFVARIEPARETSGDYYDFIPLPGGRLAILVADVADKGAGAALFMASSRTLMRTFVERYPDRPAQVLESVNRRLVEDTPEGLFVTLFYAILDPATGQITYCNAGHNPPLLYSYGSEESLHWLAGTGTAVGILPDAVWQEDTQILEPGDLLVLYTDGVTEAQNRTGEYFGETGVQEALAASCLEKGLCSAQEALDVLLGRLHAFIGDFPRSDDITAMVLHRKS